MCCSSKALYRNIILAESSTREHQSHHEGSQMTESPFLYMKKNSKTVLWNDSADPKELKDALTWGIVGATCNPVIALSALKADQEHWVGRIKDYAKSHPTSTDDAIGWAMVKELLSTLRSYLSQNLRSRTVAMDVFLFKQIHVTSEMQRRLLTRLLSSLNLQRT